MVKYCKYIEKPKLKVLNVHNTLFLLHHMQKSFKDFLNVSSKFYKSFSLNCESYVSFSFIFPEIFKFSDFLFVFYAGKLLKKSCLSFLHF